MYNTSERKRERHCTADYYTPNGTVVWCTVRAPGYLRQNDPNRAASCDCRSLSCMRCRRSVSMHEPASVIAMTSCVAVRVIEVGRRCPFWSAHGAGGPALDSAPGTSKMIKWLRAMPGGMGQER